MIFQMSSMSILLGHQPRGAGLCLVPMIAFTLPVCLCPDMLHHMRALECMIFQHDRTGHLLNAQGGASLHFFGGHVNLHPLADHIHPGITSILIGDIEAIQGIPWKSPTSGHVLHHLSVSFHCPLLLSEADGYCREAGIVRQK